MSDGEAEFVAAKGKKRKDDDSSSSSSVISEDDFVDCPCGLTDIENRSDELRTRSFLSVLASSIVFLIVSEHFICELHDFMVITPFALSLIVFAVSAACALRLAPILLIIFPVFSLRFMLECPACRMWQHANCVNVWDPLSPILDTYVCIGCVKWEHARMKARDDIFLRVLLVTHGPRFVEGVFIPCCAPMLTV